MARWLKYAGLILVFLFALVISIPFLFEKKIVRLVKGKINEQIEATFDFKDYRLGILRTFPDLHLRLDSISLIGKGEFQDVPLAEVDQLRVVLDIMTLFRGDDLLIKKVYFNRPIFRFVVLENGAANWDIVKISEDEGETPQDSTGVFTRLKYYEFKEADVKFDHIPGAMSLEIRSLNHRGSGNFGADMFDLYTETDIESLSYRMGRISYLKNARISAKLIMETNLRDSKFTFKENSFSINDLHCRFDGDIALDDDAMDMDITLDASKISFKSLLSLIPAIYKSNFDQLDTGGTVEASAVVKGRYDEKLGRSPAVDVDLKVQNAFFKHSSQPVGVDDIHFDMRITSTGNKNFEDLKVNIPKCSFTIQGNPFDMKLNATQLMADPWIDLSARGNIDLSLVHALVPSDEGIDYKGLLDLDVNYKGLLSDADQKRFDKIEASGAFLLREFNYKTPSLSHAVAIPKLNISLTPALLRLEMFELNYGESDIKAKGTLSNYIQYVLQNKPIGGSFDFTSNHLNLNELRQELDQLSEEPASDQPVETGVILIPDNINFSLRGEVGHLIYDNLDMRNVRGTVVLNEGKARIIQTEMSILGGQLSLDGTYDPRITEKPLLDFDLRIRNWDIPQAASSFITIEKLAPIANWATGRFSSQLKFSSMLDHNMFPRLYTLSGSGRLNTKNVQVSGFEPIKELASKLNIQRLAKQTIDDLSMVFRIEEGKFNVDPYEVKLGNIKAVVAGFTSLTQEIFYKINMDIPRSEFGREANRWIDELASTAASKGIRVDPMKSVQLDIIMEGTILSPKIQVRWSESTGNLLQSLREDIENQLRDKVTDLKLQAEGRIEEVKKEAIQRVEEGVEEAKARVQAELNARADQVLAEAERQAQRIRDESRQLAANIRREGELNAKRLEDEATNPVQRSAARIAADRLRREAENNAQRIENEANQRADRLMQEARVRAESIRRGE